jgi:serine/threonine-protein phosphatase 2A regulatory subunit B'
MVYNAMKLFMEVNPQLFDECSHEYTESQNNAEQRQHARQAKWERLDDLAQKMKSGLPPSAITAPGLQTTDPSSRTDDADPLRLEQLRLQDDASASVQDSTREQQQTSSVR